MLAFISVFGFVIAFRSWSFVIVQKLFVSSDYPSRSPRPTRILWLSAWLSCHDAFFQLQPVLQHFESHTESGIQQPNVHVQLAAAQELREQSIVDAKGQNELDTSPAYIARKRRNILRSWLLLWNNPFLHAHSDYRLGLSRLSDVYSLAPEHRTLSMYDCWRG